jgi:general secretion pathway protein G
MARLRRRRGGFTLLEVLIVIVIIAILAVIIIPRLLGTGRKAKEATLRGQLQTLRKAIEQFGAECGDFPADLDQLQAQPADGDPGGNGVALDATMWSGPYLTTSDGGLPKDPFTDDGTSWNYDPTTGEVHSASALTSLDGEAYADW